MIPIATEQAIAKSKVVTCPNGLDVVKTVRPNEDQATLCAINLIRSGSVRRSLKRKAVSKGFCSQGRVSNQVYRRSELRA